MRIKLCKIIGHRPGETITGFRNYDAAVITRCRFCDLPIVSPKFKAAGHIMLTLYGDVGLDAAIKWADEHEGEPLPSNTWIVYDSDLLM